MPVVIESFKAVRRNTLRGFCRARFPSGLIVDEISIHIAPNGTAWASPPSRPMVDRDGNTLRDSGGKLRWQPIISFHDKAVRDAWSAAVMQAVFSAHPEALRDAVPETEQ